MRRLIFRLFMLGLPIALIFGFPGAILWQSGETYSVSSLVAFQSQARRGVAPPTLVGLAYSDPAEWLKLQNVLDAQPVVLALGTSRTLQFRKEMFSPSVNFYNAGRGVSKIKHLRQFLAKIPTGREPKIILLGLDQYFFNAAWDNLANDDYGRVIAGTRQLSPFEILANGFRQIYSDYASNKFSFATLQANSPAQKRIGINALVNKSGFRSDGSYRYPVNDNPSHPAWRDFEYRDTYARIANNGYRFEPSDDVNKAAVDELALFLSDCQNRGIYVIGFLPPYAHVVYKTMLSSGKYGYLTKLAPTLQTLFSQRAFGFYDFSDLATVGANDAETLDGFHGSEKAYARMTLKMAQSNAALSPFVHKDHLASNIQTATSPFIVFDD